MPRGLEEGGVAVATGDQLVLIGLCRSWGKVRVDGGGEEGGCSRAIRVGEGEDRLRMST